MSKQVTSGSSRSVHVARHVIARGTEPVRVVVGVDGSRGAAAAIRAVSSRFWPSGAAVRVVGVDEAVKPTATAKLVPKATEWIHDSNHAQVADLRAMVHHAAEVFLMAGFHVSMQVIKGIPRDVLNEEARRLEADCIFVGARGTTSDGTDDKTGLGSVATALVSSAPCSVGITRINTQD